jgi:uncharacterized protein (TIGR03435 family)
MTTKTILLAIWTALLATVNAPAPVAWQDPSTHDVPQPRNDNERAAVGAFALATKAYVDRWAENLKRSVPDARLVDLPAAGHYVFLTREADVLRELREFVAATDQAPTGAAAPAFETASVDPNTSGGGAGGARLQPGGGLSATNVTLRELVEFAYQRHAFDTREVTGGPAWADSDRFDVSARSAREHVVDPDGAPRQTWLMLRALLERRFKLKAHEENRDRPVYALMRATADEKPGPKLRKSEIDCGAVMRGERPAVQPAQGPPCGLKTPPGRLFANTFTMPAFASLVSRHVDRLVIDRTGLEGRFDFELEASEIKAPPNYKPGPSDLALPPAAGPSIFIAVREQLGLKLEPQTTPVPVVVIDHAERPTPN